MSFSPDILHDVLIDFLSLLYMEYKISFAVFLCKTNHFRYCIPIYSITTGNASTIDDLLWKPIQTDSNVELFNSQMSNETFLLLLRACEEAIISNDEK